MTGIPYLSSVRTHHGNSLFRSLSDLKKETLAMNSTTPCIRKFPNFVLRARSVPGLLFRRAAFPPASPQEIYDAVTDLAVTNNNGVFIFLGNGTGGFASVSNFAVGGVGPSSAVALADLNNDTKLDVIVGKDQQTLFYVLLNDGTGTLGAATSFASGLGANSIAVGNFNNDGQPDIAIANSLSDSVTVSLGDGKMDLAVFRPTTGAWYILQSSNGLLASYFWGLEGDVPTQADFDADGKTDVAVFRKPGGIWYVLRSSDNSLTTQFWGQTGDRPLPGDYDGDDKADFVVYRPSQGAWYVRRSSGGSFMTVILTTHTPSHQTAPGDFDGDGSIDVAEWLPSSGFWNIRKRSNTSISNVVLGISGDAPVVGVYSNQ